MITAPAILSRPRVRALTRTRRAAAPNPCELELLLVAPLRNDIEVVIGAVEHVEAARIGRVGVIEAAVLVLVKTR